MYSKFHPKIALIAWHYTIVSPLIRDTRTGKLDRVLDGNFDLVEFL